MFDVSLFQYTNQSCGQTMWIELKILKDGIFVRDAKLLPLNKTQYDEPPEKLSRTAMKIRTIKGNLLNRGIRFVNFFQFKRHFNRSKTGNCFKFSKSINVQTPKKKR